MRNPALALFGLVATGLLAGCSHYIPPGKKADLNALAPADIQEGFAAEPSHPFPAGVAIVRIQAPDYSNYYLEQNGGRFGTGRYSVITVREVESDADLTRIADLPGILDIISLNRLLLPQKLGSERDLRVAASRLQADLLFLYTFDTSFFNRDSARPLSVITLGLSPTRKIRVVTTASALLLDTRTGYLYSAYEATEKRDATSTSWNTHDTADLARRAAETAAFEKLVDEVADSWPALLRRYPSRDLPAANPPAPPSPAPSA